MDAAAASCLYLDKTSVGGTVATGTIYIVLEDIEELKSRVA